MLTVSSSVRHKLSTVLMTISQTVYDWEMRNLYMLNWAQCSFVATGEPFVNQHCHDYCVYFLIFYLYFVLVCTMGSILLLFSCSREHLTCKKVKKVVQKSQVVVQKSQVLYLFLWYIIKRRRSLAIMFLFLRRIQKPTPLRIVFGEIWKEVCYHKISVVVTYTHRYICVIYLRIVI